MTYLPHVWAQIRNITADELIRALGRDAWELVRVSGAAKIYRHPETRRIVSVHYHPKRTFGPKLLKGLLRDIGWSEEDLRRLKLIK